MTSNTVSPPRLPETNTFIREEAITETQIKVSRSSSVRVIGGSEEGDEAVEGVLAGLAEEGGLSRNFALIVHQRLLELQFADRRALTITFVVWMYV
jgi:predicted ABC-type transport system involved in lysophospholipase L1 biosynthesis ATPase subunit